MLRKILQGKRLQSPKSALQLLMMSRRLMTSRHRRSLLLMAMANEGAWNQNNGEKNGERGI